MNSLFQTRCERISSSSWFCITLGWLCALLFLVGCSVEQNTFTANVYHNMTARFNSYFYAHEKAVEVEKKIVQTLDDDPTEILRLFPALDTTRAKSYVKDTEEIIKMASISIQRHPNSKWVDDSYVMVGLARLYACDFQNAILTFKYVNTKSPSPDVRHTALLHLMRTFIEQGDYDRADEVFHFLEKEKLNKENTKKMYLEKAYLYQLRHDYTNMVYNLSKADSLLVRQDRKGRIYFIIGQVYQKLGINSKAYIFYRKCLATTPDYEIDFYARLNLAQVANIHDKNDTKLVRKQFEKLLADSKNQEFRDKIYFEYGEFERKQGFVPQAIEKYKLAAHVSKIKRTQGHAYLRVGQLNFDSLKKYRQAKFYYDSAIQSLPKEFENYNAIKKRQEVLGQFVTYTEIISLNDSLLRLATMDTTLLRKQLDSAFVARDKKIVAAQKRKKKSESNTNSYGNQNSILNRTETTATTDWYFENSALVAMGQTDFQRIWGNVPLEDNWRRSNKTIVLVDSSTASTQPADTLKPAVATESLPIAKVNEASKVLMTLPYSEKQKTEALAKIEDAYLKLGDLYYFSLGDRLSATESYQKLLDRFPKSELEPEVLYKLYLIYLESDLAKATTYSDRLKSEHPQSTFAKILVNPNYLKEIRVATEKQKLIYKEAYTLYQKNDLRAAQEKIDTALQIGETDFVPQLELLKILIVGHTEDLPTYQSALEDFIEKSTDPLKSYAKELLTSSKTFQDKSANAKGNPYSTDTSGVHYFVSIYNSTDRITNSVANALDKFNTDQWKDLKLTTSSMGLTNDKILTMTVEFADRKSALKYFDKFLAQLSDTKPFSNYKFYNFVITKENFQIFYRTKALNEYLTFFDRNYQKQSQ